MAERVKGKLREDLVARGIQLHDRARDGEKGAAQQAYELFAAARELDPNDHVVEAYCGSALALIGRDAVDPNTKTAMALRGLKLLDQAIAADPENTTIRTLRAFVSYRLPETYFHRTAVAVEDFAYLAKRYEDGGRILSEEFYFQILYHLGKARQIVGDHDGAHQTWRKLLSMKPAARHLRLLRAEGMVAGPSEEEERFEAQAKAECVREGARLCTLAEAGDAEAAARACALLEKACGEYPDDALLRAYWGHSLSLAGRGATKPEGVFEHAIRGMRLLDEAAQKAPDDLRIRKLRGDQAYRLPEAFFHRTAVAVVDFQQIRDSFQQGGMDLTEKEYHQALFRLGDAYARLGMLEEARSAWAGLLSRGPQGSFQRLIKERERWLAGTQETNDGTAATSSSPKTHDEAAGGKPSSGLPSDKEALLQEGIRLHDLGVAGSREAVSDAREILRKAYEMSPDDALVQAYWGSVTALAGRDADDPSVIFGRTVEGLTLLNLAASKAPQNLTIRVLRGSVCFRLPELFFHLTEAAIEDFEYVRAAWHRREKEALQLYLTPILRDLAAAYARLGRSAEADTVRKELASLDPGLKPGPDSPWERTDDAWLPTWRSSGNGGAPPSSRGTSETRVSPLRSSLLKRYSPFKKRR